MAYDRARLDNLIKQVNEKDSKRAWKDATSSVMPYREVDRLFELEYSSVDKLNAVRPAAIATGKDSVVLLKSLRFMLHHFAQSEKTWINMDWNGLLRTQERNLQMNRV